MFLFAFLALFVYLQVSLFSLAAVPVDICGVQNGMISGDQPVIVNTTYFLTTPGFLSSDSQVRRNCSRIFSSGKILQIKVVTFNLGGEDPCSSDDPYLQIKFLNGRLLDSNTLVWCGSSPAYILETEEDVMLTYYSGTYFSAVQSGFNISLSNVSTYCEDNEEIQIGSQPFYIYSPGYPNNYPGSVTCQWQIGSSGGRIKLQSLMFQLEVSSLSSSNSKCSYDYLTFDEVQYCGFQKLSLISAWSSVHINFFSDRTYNFRGFVLQLTEEPEAAKTDEVCNLTHSAQSTSTTISVSVSAKGQFNSVQCPFILNSGSNNHVVVLEMSTVLSFLSCMDFGIEVYDGVNDEAPQIASGCAPQPVFQTIRSSGCYLYVYVELSGFQRITVNFAFSRNLKDTPPRVLYAGFANSYLWLGLPEKDNAVWFVLRGNTDNNQDYSSCIALNVTMLPISQTLLNISSYMLAFSGPDDTYMELGTDCRNSSNQQVVSSGTKVFVSLKRRQNIDIWLSYRLQTSCVPEPMLLQSSTAVATLSSNLVMHGSNQYVNNAFCRWIIAPAGDNLSTQIQVVNSDLGTYCPADNLTVYNYQSPAPVDYIMTICNKASPTILSPKGISLLVEFKTNASNTFTGFNLTYSSVSLTNACPSLTVLTSSFTEQYLTSPNYPYNYSNNMDCYWRIITSGNGQIAMEVVNMSVDQQSLSCLDRDYLQLHDGPWVNSRLISNLCGYSFIQTQYITATSAAYIHFHSDSSVTAMGFKLKYFTFIPLVKEECNGVVVDLIAYPEEKFVTSPNYPDYYPANTFCQWRIKSSNSTQIIAIDVIDSKLETSTACNFDYVSIFDGDSALSLLIARFCGYMMPTSFYGSGQYIFVQFSSDTSGQLQGFNISYRTLTEIPLDASEYHPGNGQTGPIIGGVIGGAFVLIMLITFIFCYIGRRKKANNNAQPSLATSQQHARNRRSSREGNSTVYFMTPVIVNQLLPPPPYPGHSNPAFTLDDLPPAYASILLNYHSDEDAPPSYAESMHTAYLPNNSSITGSNSQHYILDDDAWSRQMPQTYISQTLVVPASTVSSTTAEATSDPIMTTSASGSSPQARGVRPENSTISDHPQTEAVHTRRKEVDLPPQSIVRHSKRETSV